MLRKILEIRGSLHGAGTVSADVLKGIVRHTRDRRIQFSVETGCGATTLLLSHLSENHTVFAVDYAGSIRNVRQSSLLRKDVVRFVEGPSQLHLPRHAFEQKVQLALIDGPHAYPFPDLEYYYLYPHLDTGAILILDDIHIPTIHNLFRFLRSDDMFQLDEVISSTAFFTRTSSPVFDPAGDNWCSQKHNQRWLFRYQWRSALGSMLPPAIRTSLRKLMRREDRSAAALRSCSVEITSPAPNEVVPSRGVVCGRATLGSTMHLWVLARRSDQPNWWAQGGGPVEVVNGLWTAAAGYGESCDAGFQFQIAAVVVSEAVNEAWLEWAVSSSEGFPPAVSPHSLSVIRSVVRTVRRAAS
ncbi:MAG: class I SAM-dependent methyltransferase [Bryobacterales bacterium]|nr:class I SAM-dependent methyltransferase [Bryobacterales bacterium]